MRKIKKLLAVLVCAAMALTVVPGLTVSAETSVIQSKIDDLFSLLGNNYFNVSRDGSCGKGQRGHGCPNCSTPNIIQAPWFVELFGNITLEQMPRYYINDSMERCYQNAMSCMGFAVFAEWYIFKSSNSDVITTDYVGTYDYNLENMNAHVKIGDVLRLGGAHSAIFIRADENGAYVIDSNYNINGEKGNCVVYEHYIGYSEYGRCTVSRASNYNEVQPDTPSSGGETEPDDPPAEDEKVIPDGLEYEVYDDHVEITDYTGNAAELDIPDKIEGLPVTSIGDSAFFWLNLTSVTIPSSVTSIGDYAFYYCDSLISVTIGDSVTSIGDSAFSYCDSLTSVTIPDSVTGIGDSAFSYCDSLTSVKIPDSVTGIGYRAFFHCSSLTSVTIGDGVTGIGENAFYGCYSLTDITVDDDNLYYCGIDGVLFDREAKTLIQYPIGNPRKAYTIPGSVTGIGEGAFDSCDSLTSVTIGDGVTSIGAYSFADCGSLTSVTIPDSVTSIGNGAFSYCSSLTSVTIPDSVTSIGRNAFGACRNLTDIIVDDDNLYYCDIDGVLFDREAKTLIQYPKGKPRKTYTIPDSVTSIGDFAFYQCDSLTNVTIPGSVTSIGYQAFSYCDSLTSVTIGNGVTSIGNFAFDGCNSLADVYYAGSEEDWANIDISYSNDPLLDANIHYNSTGPAEDENVIPDGLEYEVYDDHVEITGYYGDAAVLEIPDEIEGLPVTGIGEKAFYFCGLTNVTIPDSVTSIGYDAFFCCDSLTSVTIPDSVTSIGKSAFYGCGSLTSVTIPGSVTSIGENAFADCDSLTDITVDDDNLYYCDIDGVLFDREAKTLIQYPIGNPREAYTIPGSVTSIGDYAFSHCYSLTSVTIPNGVASIDKNAFYSCDSLTDIIVDDDNLYYCDIDGVLFDSEAKTLIQYPAGNLRKTYTIPGSVTVIGDYAFQFCESLTSVTIGDSVTGIGRGAFADCLSLTSVTIPDSVTSIGDYAFSHCDSLTSVTIPNSVTNIGNSAFADCKSLTSVTIPDSVTSIGESAFWCCDSLTNVTIPDSVTSIGAYTFGYCSSLTNVTIPDSVTSIGKKAFYFCGSLTSVIIGGSVTSIGEGAFWGCDSLTDVYYAGSEEDWANINISIGNNSILDANIHYNSTGPKPAPEISVPEVSQNGDELTVTVETSDVPESAAVIAIGRGEDGGVIDIAAVENGEAKLIGENVRTVMVFAWESLESMRPLCPAKEVTLQ